MHRLYRRDDHNVSRGEDRTKPREPNATRRSIDREIKSETGISDTPRRTFLNELTEAGFYEYDRGSEVYLHDFFRISDSQSTRSG